MISLILCVYSDAMLLYSHAPMFADQDFADFSQEIGLASLGASDDDIKKLATCYWHTVEFGLVKDADGVKAYGAGLLSSFGELEYSCNTSADPAPGTERTPKLLKWDPRVAAVTEYPICSYQPVYFVAENLSDAKMQMRLFCERLQKPFHARYNSLTSSIWVDRAVKVEEVDNDYSLTNNTISRIEFPV
jgi:phenylalanine-4-hydroxylase